MRNTSLHGPTELSDGLSPTVRTGQRLGARHAAHRSVAAIPDAFRVDERNCPGFRWSGGVEHVIAEERCFLVEHH